MTLFYRIELFSRIDRATLMLMLTDALTPYELKSEQKSDQPELNTDESKFCKVCIEEITNALLEPCNHLCVCEGCANRLTNCPICRAKIENVKKIFIS